MITNINKIFVAVALIILARNSCAGQLNDAFSGLEVGIYTGKLMLPTGYVVVDGIWRDNVGKEIAEPKVNFAGKYWVGLHSCGFGCRYYSMVDLSSGTETHMLDIFSSTDPPAKTRDGHLYFSNLVTRAQSKMLIDSIPRDTRSSWNRRVQRTSFYYEGNLFNSAYQNKNRL
jgi:hypothetical protein